MRTQFHAALLLTLGALAAAPALAQTGTIQTAGPRPGVNGARFFNIEGVPAFASYGIARFNVGAAKSAFDAQFGAGNYTLSDVSLSLTESNAAFTAPGSLLFDFTPDNASDINSAKSPFKFSGPVPAGQQLILTGAATTTGSTNNGQVDKFDLFNATAGSAALQSDILTNPLATLVVNPGDATVAATYGGGANFTLFPVLNITATSNTGVSSTFGALTTPEPSALAFALVGVPGVALFLRRRKK